MFYQQKKFNLNIPSMVNVRCERLILQIREIVVLLRISSFIRTRTTAPFPTFQFSFFSKFLKNIIEEKYANSEGSNKYGPNKKEFSKNKIYYYYSYSPKRQKCKKATEESQKYTHTLLVFDLFFREALFRDFFNFVHICFDVINLFAETVLREFFRGYSLLRNISSYFIKSVLELCFHLILPYLWFRVVMQKLNKLFLIQIVPQKDQLSNQSGVFV